MGPTSIIPGGQYYSMDRLGGGSSEHQISAVPGQETEEDFALRDAGLQATGTMLSAGPEQAKEMYEEILADGTIAHEGEEMFCEKKLVVPAGTLAIVHHVSTALFRGFLKVSAALLLARAGHVSPGVEAHGGRKVASDGENGRGAAGRAGALHGRRRALAATSVLRTGLCALAGGLELARQRGRCGAEPSGGGRCGLDEQGGVGAQSALPQYDLGSGAHGRCLQAGEARTGACVGRHSAVGAARAVHGRGGAWTARGSGGSVSRRRCCRARAAGHCGGAAAAGGHPRHRREQLQRAVPGRRLRAADAHRGGCDVPSPPNISLDPVTFRSTDLLVFAGAGTATCA